MVGIKELEWLAVVARAIVQDVLAKGSPELGKNYGAIEDDAALPFIGAQSIPGQVTQTTLIKAQCLFGRAIQIKVPADGRRTATSGSMAVVESTVFGALVHELVHVRQFNLDSSSFQATSARQRESEAAGLQRTSSEWLATYYIEPLEREAHAYQLAAELRCIGLTPAGNDPHGSWTKATEVGRRIHGRLFPPGTAHDEGVEAWWRAFLATAAEIGADWTAGPAAALSAPNEARDDDA